MIGPLWTKQNGEILIRVPSTLLNVYVVQASTASAVLKYKSLLSRELECLQRTSAGQGADKLYIRLQRSSSKKARE